MDNNESMHTQNLGSVLVGIVIGLLLAFFVYPSLYTRGAMPMMGYGGSKAGDTTDIPRRADMMGTIERHFIEQMIPHHEDAIAMARLALEKAEYSEIKTLAQNIITAQEAENAQMSAWYKEWFGNEVPAAGTGMMGMTHGGGMMQGGMMGATADFNDLKNAKPFDKEFIEQMIPHHQMAIMMAQMLAVSAEREEMKQLAGDIIEAQQKEIDQMREWYQAWY